MATIRNIEIIRGENVTKQFVVRLNGDLYFSVVDPSGKVPIFSAKYDYRNEDADAVIWKDSSPSISINSSDSTITVNFYTADTKNLPNWELPLKYELAIKDFSNNKVPVLRGDFIINPTTISLGSSGVTTIDAYGMTFTSLSTVTIPAVTHGITAPFIVSVYVGSPLEQVTPQSIEVDSGGNITITFDTALTGNIVILG